MVSWREAAVSAAASRASWLAELAAAVEHAHELIRLMSADRDDSGRWRDLYWRLDSMRAEIDDLRHAGRGGRRHSYTATIPCGLFDDSAKGRD